MNRNILTKAVAFLALAALAGCAKKLELPEAPAIATAGGFYVREFQLSDGTRCVSMVKTGITCNWSKQ